jgi:MFS family permease
MNKQSVDDPYSWPVVALSLAIANMTFGFGIFFPYLPLFAEALGANLGLQIALLTTGFMAARTLTALPFGSISDQIGRKNSIVIGLFIYGVITILFYFSQDWTHVLLLRTIQGITAGLIWPSSRAMIYDLVGPGARGRAISVLNISAGAGMAFGPIFGAFLLSYSQSTLTLDPVDSFRIPFIFAGGFGLFSSLFAFLTLSSASVPSQRTRFFKMIDNLDSNYVNTFYSSLLMNVAHGFAFGMFRPVLVLYIYQVLGYSLLETASISAISFSLGAFSNSISQIIGGRLADSRNRKYVVSIAVILSQIATFSILFVNDIFQLYIVIIIRFSTIGLFIPSLASLEGDIIPANQRGQLSGLVEGFRGIGSAIGPLICLALYDYVWTGSPFVVSPAIFIIFLIIYYIYYREP